MFFTPSTNKCWQVCLCFPPCHTNNSSCTTPTLNKALWPVLPNFGQKLFWFRFVNKPRPCQISKFPASQLTDATLYSAHIWHGLSSALQCRNTCYNFNVHMYVYSMDFFNPKWCGLFGQLRRWERSKMTCCQIIVSGDFNFTHWSLVDARVKKEENDNKKNT